MKRWAAITALAVMAVPTAFILGDLMEMAIWRLTGPGHCVAGGGCIKPNLENPTLNVVLFGLALASTAVWWVGWYRLTRPDGRPSAGFGASKILAVEFVLVLALPLFLSVSGLSPF